jgi:hypothetical protein
MDVASLDAGRSRELGSDDGRIAQTPAGDDATCESVGLVPSPSGRGLG